MAVDFGARIAFGAGTGVNSIPLLRAEAAWAESVGFHGFWVSQVFGVDPIVAVAALGAASPGLREFGTSVVPLAGRHPLALAAQARTAQSALDGRFTLGIGTSHQMVVEGFFGEPWRQMAQRTAEYLGALGPLLRGESCSVEGDHVFAKGWLTIEAEPVPILLAAMGPRMLEIAGRLTAGTTLGSCGPRTIATHIAPTINAAAKLAGREQPRIMARVGVCVTADVAGLREHDRVQNVMYDAFPSYRAMLDREGVQSGADLLVAGTIDDVVEGLAAYVAAGVTDLRVAIAARTDDEREATKEALANILRR